MEPYRVTLDDWTLAMYSTDDGRLTFTVTNSSDPDDYMTKIVGEVRMRRYYLGQQCAGELHPSPWPTYRDGRPSIKYIELDDEGNDPVLTVRSASKEALLAAEDAG